MARSSRIRPCVWTLVFALPLAPALAQRVSIEVFEVSAYRQLRAGAHDTAETGVVGVAKPAGQAFVVVEAHVKNARHKNGDGDGWVKPSDFSLSIGGFEAVAVGELTSTDALEFFRAGRSIPDLHPGGAKHTRLVFDAAVLEGAPWTLRIADAQVDVPAVARIEDAMPTLAEHIDAEILSVARLASYTLGAGPRATTRVEYTNPSGVFIKATLRLRLRSHAPERSCECAIWPSLSTTSIGLRVKHTGMYIPNFAFETDQAGVNYPATNVLGMTFHLRHDRPQTLRLLFAAPKDMNDFDVLVLGEPIASHALGQ